MVTQMKIRIILADGQPLAIAGARHFLASVNTIDVVGTARNSGEVVEQLDRAACDILISEYSMPNGNYGDGLAYFSFLTRSYPDLKIIVYTTVDDSSLLAELARLGIRSVVSKASDMEQLVLAIDAVFTGNTRFQALADSTEVDSGLSAKEAEVIRLFASGLTIAEISHRLCRSKKTISSHKSNAKQKLGIGSDAGLFSPFCMRGAFAAAF